MKLKREKLFNGCVDVRSYERDEAIRKDESIAIALGTETMTLSPKDLLKKGWSTGTIFRKKFGSGTYTLVSYKWEPDQKKDNQLTLL